MNVLVIADYDVRKEGYVFDLDIKKECNESDMKRAFFCMAEKTINEHSKTERGKQFVDGFNGEIKLYDFLSEYEVFIKKEHVQIPRKINKIIELPFDTIVYSKYPVKAYFYRYKEGDLIYKDFARTFLDNVKWADENYEFKILYHDREIIGFGLISLDLYYKDYDIQEFLNYAAERLSNTQRHINEVYKDIRFETI